MRPYKQLIACLLFAFLASASAWGQQTKEQLASYYYNNGDFDQASELFESLYQKAANKYYYQMLYNSYVNAGNYKDAEHLVEKRIKQNPKDLYLYVDLGALYGKKGDKKKAEKSYNDAVSRMSGDSRQLSDLVAAFDNVGLFQYAEKCYLKVREKTGNNYVYVNELAAVYERMGNYEAMMQEYFNLLDHSPGSINSIQISLQRVLNQTSNPQLEAGLRKTLVSRVQADPSNSSYLEMMLWFSLQQKDFQFAYVQAKSIDARFPAQQGEPVLRVARIAHTNGDYAVAADSYGYLIKKGGDTPYYYEAKVGLLDVKFDRLNPSYNLSTKDYAALKKEYENAFQELGKTEQTVPLMRNYAQLTAYYGNEIQVAADMLYDALEIPRLPNKAISEIKLELGDLLLFAGEVWDASLTYMQVEKANKEDVLGAQAKFRNAKLSYYNHDFGWAKSQLEVLRASTSKLVANDAMELSLLISDNMEADSTYDMLELYATADMLQYRNLLDSAWDMYDMISHRALSHPLFDEVLMQKAKIRIKQGRYDEADSLLQKLVEFYPDDILADDALILSAQLNEDHLNNIERARSCYEKLILDYPSSLYVDGARKRYNELKSK